MPETNPHLTADLFKRGVPSHVPQDAVEDGLRLQAYDTYADLYHNVPDVFKVAVVNHSGEEMYRRYIPSARSIVEATNRFLGQGLHWVATPPEAAAGSDPLAGPADTAMAASDALIGATMGLLDPFFKREEFGPKFLSAKRWMLIHGDALLHITADASKPEGSRIRLTELHPGSYFPITDPMDDERVTGCYIINIVDDDEGEQIVQRLEYRKVTDPEVSAMLGGAALGAIYVKLTFWEPGGWDGRRDEEDLKPVDTPTRYNLERMAPLLAGTTLPAQITALPVYHFRNTRRGNDIWGTSEVQGIETLIAGINQTATDEEIAVALQGLGMYWTDSGRPVDTAGNATDWEISPASMLELDAGTQVGRVQGIGSVQPSQDHLSMLKREARESTGTPDVAVGTVDVQAAQSGIALEIQFRPITSKNAEKEEQLRNKLDQLLYDLLNGWFPAYEGWAPNGVTVTAEFGDPLPVDTRGWIDQVNILVTSKIISAATAREILKDKLGMMFPADEQATIAEETNAALDAQGVRLDAAVAGGIGESTSDPGAEV